MQTIRGASAARRARARLAERTGIERRAGRRRGRVAVVTTATSRVTSRATWCRCGTTTLCTSAAAAAAPRRARSPMCRAPSSSSRSSEIAARATISARARRPTRQRSCAPTIAAPVTRNPTPSRSMDQASSGVRLVTSSSWSCSSAPGVEGPPAGLRPPRPSRPQHPPRPPRPPP